MPSAVRPLTAGLIVLTALLAGCGDTPDSSEAGAGPSTPASAPASTALDAASTEPAREPHILVLTAAGSGTVDKFTYVLDGRATNGGSVRLPWRQSVDIPADGLRHEYSLTVQFRKGAVDLVAIFNGQEVARSNGSSSGKGTASVGGGVLG